MFASNMVTFSTVFWVSFNYHCCILSFGWFRGVWIVCAEFSEHSVCSIFLLTSPMKMKQCSETSAHTIRMEQRISETSEHKIRMEQRISEKWAHKIQTPGNHPKDRIKHSEHGESLISISIITFCPLRNILFYWSVHVAPFPNYMYKYNDIFKTVHWKIIFNQMSWEVRPTLSCFKILVAFFISVVNCTASLSHALS